MSFIRFKMGLVCDIIELLQEEGNGEIWLKR